MTNIRYVYGVVKVDDDVVNDGDEDDSLLLLSPAKLKLRLRCALSICQK